MTSCPTFRTSAMGSEVISSASQIFQRRYEFSQTAEGNYNNLITKSPPRQSAKSLISIPKQPRNKWKRGSALGQDQMQTRAAQASQGFGPLGNGCSSSCLWTQGEAGGSCTAPGLHSWANLRPALCQGCSQRPDSAIPLLVTQTP